MNETKSVSYQEALSIKVGGFLVSKGFDLASSAGIAESSLVETCSLGILQKDPGAKPRYLFGLIKLKSRRGFLGVVWFNNQIRGATEQNWVFEVHGRKHIESAKKLAEEMVAIFDVNIDLILASEQPAFETRLLDLSL